MASGLMYERVCVPAVAADSDAAAVAAAAAAAGSVIILSGDDDLCNAEGVESMCRMSQHIKVGGCLCSQMRAFYAVGL
jgi:hypothetical protein